MERFRVTIVVVEKRYYIFWECVCSLRYPACNAHVPYFHLCPARLCNIFPHFHINGTIFDKKFLKTKCVLFFFFPPHSFCLKHFLFWEAMREIRSKMYIGLHVKCSLFLSHFKDTWIFSIDFRKFSNFKFLGNPSNDSRVVSMWKKRRTDRHDEDNNRF